MSKTHVHKFVLKKWSVIGHERIISSLKNCILKNQIPHAFLFSGPSNVGKTLIAYNFIKSTLCQGTIRPCGVCESCKKVEQKLHPDAVILEKEKSLKIKDIRKIKYRLSLSPSVSSYKICLLNNANSLTKEAANALLKILEEPKGKTIIILISENYERLLSTIVSRCILIKFSIPSFSDNRKYFTLHYKGKIKEKILDKIILNSEHKPGIIHYCLENQEKIAKIENIREELENILLTSQNDYKRIDYASKFTKKDAFELEETFNIWLTYFRNLMFYELGILDRTEKLFSEKLLRKYSLKKIKNNILETNKAFLFLSKNINKKLLVENLIMNL